MTGRTAPIRAGADDPIDVEITLESSIAAPAQARAGVDGLREVLERDRFEDLQLVLSELVTNSAKYGPGDPIVVSVKCDGGEVVGDVTDRAEGRIELYGERHAERRHTVGRWGLSMVECLTSDWGLRNRDRTVWFRLA